MDSKEDENKDIFKRIDNVLDTYYLSKGIADYKNQNGVGKFLLYCNENELQEDEINEELSGDVQDCIYLEALIDDFPFDAFIQTQTDKENELFRILKMCYVSCTKTQLADNVYTAFICNKNDKTIKYEIRNKKFNIINSTQGLLGGRMNVHCNGNKTDNKMNCISLQRLSSVMQTYHLDYELNTDIIDLDLYIDVDQAVNDFLHLITQHDDNESFEQIYNHFGGFCDYQKCHIFHRYHMKPSRRASCYKRTTNIEKRILIDRIHCYYNHCYDAGIRLTNIEMKCIENACYSDKDKNSDHVEDTLSQHMKNEQILKIKKLLSSKRKGNDHRMSRFNAFNTHKAKKKLTDNSSMYSFGFIFDYPKHSTHCTVMESKHEKYHQNWKYHHIGKVNPKYNHLKEELTENKISSISVTQFIVEVRKAVIYFNSDYCKTHFKQKYQYSDRHSDYLSSYIEEGSYYRILIVDHDDDQISSFEEYDKDCYGEMETNIVFSIEHILSIMFYCNYTELQCEFSKTYRKIRISESKYQLKRRHGNFFWLGKHLKDCVNYYGQSVSQSNIKCLYHGVGEPLTFPSLTGNWRGINIYGPLSTTTSYVAAVNFTNSNNGIVVSFGIHQYTNNLVNVSRYFSCSWLSDFGNEQEHLFIQNEHGYFEFVNIIHLPTTTEFEIILKSFRMLHALIALPQSHEWYQLLTILKCRNIDKIMDQELLTSLDETFGIKCNKDKQNIIELIDRMIQHRLCVKTKGRWCKYQQFTDLHDYAKQLLDQFCDTQRDLILRKKAFQEFGFSKLIPYFWTKLKSDIYNKKTIRCLFPNALLYNL